MSRLMSVSLTEDYDTEVTRIEWRYLDPSEVEEPQ